MSSLHIRRDERIGNEWYLEGGSEAPNLQKQETKVKKLPKLDEKRVVKIQESNRR